MEDKCGQEGELGSDGSSCQGLRGNSRLLLSGVGFKETLWPQTPLASKGGLLDDLLTP